MRRPKRSPSGTPETTSPCRRLASIARSLSLSGCVAALAACGSSSQIGPASEDPEPPALPAVGIQAGSAREAEMPQPAPACPEGMVFIDTLYCPKVRRKCLDNEHNTSNRIYICHTFAPGTDCLSPVRRQRFCIDKYEYPNREGGHPPVMVSWHDAAGACASQGKRLCWESEWVSACEGPDQLPFPYGWNRDSKQCNIDNRWLRPSLEKVYSKRPDVQNAELWRLDQSVPSGARPGCVSGFGVHDLTGNFDEWVNAERLHEKSKWAGLKGGAWGHVRNACRPMTTSHDPDFTYYFISFRCCADPAPDPAAEADPKLWKPPPPPKQRNSTGNPSPGWTSTRRGPHQPK